MMRIWSLILFTAALACSPSQHADDEVFQQSIVTLNGSDEPIVTTRTITAAQQRAEVDARKSRLAARSGTKGVLSQAISQDVGCGDASIMVFDDINLTGNEICFFGYDSALLGQYVRTVLRTSVGPLTFSWERAVRSYFPGDEDGDFMGGKFQLLRGFCQVNFAGIGDTLPSPVDVAGSCAKDAIWLDLND
jgi:hypothetical protein